MNLYEIDGRIMEAFDQAVDPDTGEVVDGEAYERLNELQMLLEDKTEGILLWIKNLTAKAEALKKEKLAFAERQAAAEKKAESLKRYVSGVLRGEKFATDRVQVTWRKSETAEYTGDIRALPKECIRVKEPEIDKAALKKLLKSGGEIAGAELVVHQNMQIR